MRSSSGIQVAKQNAREVITMRSLHVGTGAKGGEGIRSRISIRIAGSAQSDMNNMASRQSVSIQERESGRSINGQGVAPYLLHRIAEVALADEPVGSHGIRD
jgi:hypothetical protein